MITDLPFEYFYHHFKAVVVVFLTKYDKESDVFKTLSNRVASHVIFSLFTGFNEIEFFKTGARKFFSRGTAYAINRTKNIKDCLQLKQHST